MADAGGRFWKEDNSEVDEDESSSSSDDDQEIKKQQPKRLDWMDDQNSDSESDGGRIVRTAADKTVDAVRKVAKDLKNSLKINDWNTVLSKYDDLKKEEVKAKRANKDNHVVDYLLALQHLQESIEALFEDKPALRKLSKTNNKAFNRLRARVPKEIAELGSIMENLPDPSSEVSDESSDSSSSSSSSGDSSDSDSDSDSDSSKSSGDEESAKVSSREGADDWDSDEDSEDWDSSSSSSSSDESGAELTGRARWVKRVPQAKAQRMTVEEANAAQAERKRKAEEKKREKEKAKAEKEQQEQAAQAQAETLSPREIEEGLMALVANRGKKGLNKYEQLEKMRKLVMMLLPLGPHKMIAGLMHLISAQFDVKNGMDEHMPLGLWQQAVKDIRFVLRILNANPDLRLGQVAGDELGALSTIMREKAREKKEKAKKTDSSAGGQGEADGENPAADGENPADNTEEEEADDPRASIGILDADLNADGTKSNTIRVVGDLGFFVDRLDEEYTKCLRQTDPHTQDYINRLSDEGILVDIASDVMNYFKRIEDLSNASRMCLLCIEHIYYKHDTISNQLQREQMFTATYGSAASLHPACLTGAGAGSPGGVADVKVSHPGAALGAPTSIIARLEIDFDPAKLLEELCEFMYQHGDSRGQARALLCQIYHFALHDQFYRARDLLLMSHLQDNIMSADIDTQILHNRMTVQLGLAAFRAELIPETHACLMEVCGNKKEKELLAQGLSWRNMRDRNLEQEAQEKRRLMPYHMHINLELLDAVYLTSAMLLEIPSMASMEFDAKYAAHSRQFRRLTDIYAEQVFTGLPENTKDHVLAASLALKEGDWRTATNLLLDKLTVWDLFQNGKEVRAMIYRRVKDEALRTYMLTYSTNYISIQRSHLCELFDMEPANIHAIISKMIITGELAASWDEPRDVLVVHKREPTHLQALALQFSDRLAHLVESNERLLNVDAFGDNRNRRDRDEKGRGGFRGGRGGRGGRTGGVRTGYRGGYRGGRGGHRSGGFRPRGGFNRFGSTRTDRAPI